MLAEIRRVAALAAPTLFGLLGDRVGVHQYGQAHQPNPMERAMPADSTARSWGMAPLPQSLAATGVMPLAMPVRMTNNAT